MPLSRRTLLGSAALPLFAIHSRPARAAEFTLKYANNTPATHPLTLRMQEAADRILKATDGRVEVQVFPNNQLGSDTDMLSQLRSGAIELFTLSGLILSTLVPPASINGVGFAFKNYDQVWSAMDGKLGAYVRGEIAKRGLLPMETMFDNGFRQTTTSSKPIVVPADFKGVKLRVPASPLWTSMFSALGASPVTINFAETYSALQTKIADGQENPLNLLETAKLYEVQKYCSLTNHMWDGFWLLANKRAFDRIPADAQAVMAREFKAAALAEREDIAKANADIRAVLQRRGMQINDCDSALFREALKSAGFYKEWKGKYGDEAWAVLEGAVGSVS
ncbi:MAG: TRAP transporter substrate-binding protein [Janthinobacterium lividum]